MFDNIVKNVGDNLRIMYINYPCQYNSDSAPLQSLGYLGTVSESLGCSVDLMDANFRFNPRTTGDIVSQIRKRKPHLIGMTLYTQTVLYGYGLLEQLKDTFSDCLYLAGGPHATILPHETLQHGFDIACRGEGERVIANIIGFLRRENGNLHP
ncbi:cobalamin-dependent protein [Thermodesulfobacteriota bacterium]